ncbi:MAG: HAMP domain-containing sensor histidine kinase [Methylococcales bacterium]
MRKLLIKILDLLQPLSLQELVWVGFAIAVLPLLVAIFSTINAIGNLADYSQTSVIRAVYLTQDSRILLERLSAMERSSKQYLVLEDPVFLATYQQEHENYVTVIERLNEYIENKGLSQMLMEITNEEIEIYRVINSTTIDDEKKKRVSERFKPLIAGAHSLWKNSSDVVEVVVEQLDKKSHTIKDHMIERFLLLLSGSMLLLLIFVRLIIRPIRQINSAIKKLGNGELDTPVQVAGPKDLEKLGNRLNWLRKRLIDLEEDKRRFLRSVSHELKTPLTSINEGAELLRDEVVGELNREQHEIANILLTSGRKLYDYIEELINYSQLQSQQDEGDRVKINFKALIETVIGDYTLQLKANDIEVIADLQPITAYGISDKMRTITDNLMSNAVKYSPKGGKIRISLQEKGNSVHLDIEDDGPGIAKNEYQQVFEPYYRGRSKKHEDVSGTGIGLAIVSEYVASHHGHIYVLPPTKKANGAHFRVQFPRDRREGSRQK